MLKPKIKKVQGLWSVINLHHAIKWIAYGMSNYKAVEIAFTWAGEWCIKQNLKEFQNEAIH